ncbi:apolipoprotein N-acyltransferase [Synechococcus sp. A15-62]|uniref:apolipoprotein N-acyltransferase n=1 Tax=Synechococcus sp. A15-62 TaxID=1050657 RepID=UPI0016455B93|nr:apolipoprotein N-acyltransferase [Synechococcus sp. A15-62]
MGNHQLKAGSRALLGGVLAGVAPSLGGPLLMVPALALLWSVAERPRWSAGWGLLAVLISHSWLLALHPLTWMGVPAWLSLPVALAIWLACGSLAALLLAGWSVLARWLPHHWPRPVRLMLLAGVWALAELVLSGSPLFWIGVGGTTLPWDRPLAGLARWFGSGGLTWLQLCWGCCLLALFEQPAAWRRWGMLGLASVLLAHGLGSWLLSAPPPVGSVALGVWQPAVPTREKFDLERQQALPMALVDAMRQLEPNNPAAVVAPEGALPARFQLPAEAPAVPLISGGFRWVRGQQRSSLLLYEPSDWFPVPLADKHRLVPIGEWIPPLPAGLTAGLSAVGGLSPGPAPRTMAVVEPPAAVAICYEIADGLALARAAADGATWLLAIANLDPYPLQLQEQFLALAQLRAIETGRDLLSVGNTGPTALISANGSVQRLLAPEAPGVAEAVVQVRQRVTPYSRWISPPPRTVSPS